VRALVVAAVDQQFAKAPRSHLAECYLVPTAEVDSLKRPPTEVALLLLGGSAAFWAFVCFTNSLIRSIVSWSEIEADTLPSFRTREKSLNGPLRSVQSGYRPLLIFSI
jgi:hypothetical protein